MSDPSRRGDLEALRDMIQEIDDLISTIDSIPEDRAKRFGELSRTALALADDLIAHPPGGPAALGSRGGKATLAKGGSGYFSKIAAMRKTKGGGRPKKNP
jgi:hypothetical protein